MGHQQAWNGSYSHQHNEKSNPTKEESSLLLPNKDCPSIGGVSVLQLPVANEQGYVNNIYSGEFLTLVLN
jgi:hypothetical protein